MKRAILQHSDVFSPERYLYEKIKEKNRTDYAFRRQLNEKPSIILGCPGQLYEHLTNKT